MRKTVSTTTLFGGAGISVLNVDKRKIMLVKNNFLKTPLRYPGGKSRAIKKMSPYFPDLGEYDSFREPFLGGGSVALWVSQTYPTLPVWVNDLHYPLFNFWVNLRDRGDALKDDLLFLKSINDTQDKARELFNEAKEKLDDADDYTKAVYFYIINKCSFSGLTESSSFSPQASVSNFSVRGIDKLDKYQEVIKDWKITNKSYETMLDSGFVYLDPPYEIGKNYLYGKKGSTHKGFDHDLFADNCNSSTADILISYNTSSTILDRFEGWEASTYDLTYTMRSTGDYMDDQSKRKELLLWNYEQD